MDTKQTNTTITAVHLSVPQLAVLTLKLALAQAIIGIILIPILILGALALSAGGL